MAIENADVNERYARKDVEGGYIYNKSEISFYKQVQNIDIANNLMLGDYNKNGNYTLDAEIIEQLVGLTKVYQYSFGSNMFCQSLSDIDEFGKLDFTIRIAKDHPKVGYTTALLELLEPIDKANGYYTNTNTVQIKKYTAKETNSFIVDVLKEFNVISKKDTGLIAKKKSENYDLIAQRKKYEQMRKKMLEEKVEDIYKNTFNKKIKLLGKSTEGKKVLDEFNKASYKLNGWFVKEGMKGYYKAMDEILQSIIENNKEDLLKDVKLATSLNKVQADCAKMLSDAIIVVERAIGNAELYAENITLLEANKRQMQIQYSNQTSVTIKEDAPKPSAEPAKSPEAEKQPKTEEQTQPKKAEKRPRSQKPKTVETAPAQPKKSVEKSAVLNIVEDAERSAVLNIVEDAERSAVLSIVEDDDVVRRKAEQVAESSTPKSKRIEELEESM